MALLARERGRQEARRCRSTLTLQYKTLADAVALDAAKHPEEEGIPDGINMASELKSINLVAPGFKGINTEDSPIAQDPFIC